MKTKKKISLIGAGNIGGTMASILASNSGVEVLLYDINDGIAKGKVLDIMQMSAAMGLDAEVHGTGDISEIENSDVVIVTAGLPRGPNMTRDDLLNTNAEIIKSVAENVKKYSPKAFCIIVTNPLDAMVFLFQKTSGIDPKMVVGMAGTLDTARFKHFLAQEFKVSVASVGALVLGGHGDSMVPLVSCSTIGGIPVLDVIKTGLSSKERLEEIIKRTRNGGGEIASLLVKGSAFCAPAFCAVEIAQSFLFDQKKLLPVCACLNGEYGMSDIYFGVPAIIDKKGISKIVEVLLTTEEGEMMKKSIESVKDLISRLKF